jgi:hypothetical protein
LPTTHSYSRYCGFFDGDDLAHAAYRSSPPSKIRFKAQNIAPLGLLVPFSAKIRKDILAT